ncbi:MAG: MotA/TolQ/ExbB proton channel family protein [Verrucomicrobiales bacterium]|jgi:biopolymer transport protein ExbB
MTKMPIKRHKLLTMMRPILYILIVFLFSQWWLTDFVAAELTDQSGNTSTQQSDEITVLSVYKSGGWVMHVLLLCSIATIAVIVYCFIRLSAKKMCPEGINDSMIRLMQSRDVSGAYALCNENTNSFSNVLSAALLKVNFERDRANKDSMDQAAGEELDYEETSQMQWVTYLNVFATIAPMIGLFGTVLGMMQSFGDLSAGKSEPADLAGGINSAMGTTAGGLFVGIPAMFFYFFFRNRLMGIMSLIQKRAGFALDVLSGEVRLSDEGAPEG